MYKAQIRKYFFIAVKQLREIDPLLRDSLLRCEVYHTKTTQIENIERFIENLAREFEAAQKIRVLKKGRPPYSQKVMKDTVSDMVKVFCQGLENHAKRMHESDISKSMRNKTISDNKEMELMSDGLATGEFEEAGVKIATDREPRSN